MTLPPPPPATDMPSPTTRTLKYRPIRRSDTDTLVAMREACGWGAARIPGYFSDPDKVIWLFFYDRRDGEGGQRRDGIEKTMESGGDTEEETVAMGGIILDVPEDQQVASRKLGIVQLTALFIYQHYQGSGLGNHILHALEALAIESYGCKTLSLDTLAYEKLEDNEWHGEGSGPATMEEQEELDGIVGGGTLSQNARWYLRRGYKMCQPMSLKYPRLLTGDPTPYYLGRLMHKPAVSTEDTRRLAGALLS